MNNHHQHSGVRALLARYVPGPRGVVVVGDYIVAVNPDRDIAIYDGVGRVVDSEATACRHLGYYDGGKLALEPGTSEVAGSVNAIVRCDPDGLYVVHRRLGGNAEATLKAGMAKWADYLAAGAGGRPPGFDQATFEFEGGLIADMLDLGDVVEF